MSDSDAEVLAALARTEFSINQPARQILLEIAARMESGPVFEPRIHSHIGDGLPEGHPKAYEHFGCENCEDLVHANNNECMQTWIETGKGDFCMQCWADLLGGSEDLGRFSCLDDEWGINSNQFAGAKKNGKA